MMIVLELYIRTKLNEPIIYEFICLSKQPFDDFRTYFCRCS